jgi:outer membrane immunogenic protein
LPVDERLAGCLIVLIGTPVIAADMQVTAPPRSSPPRPVWSWTGFYIGGNAGYGVGRDPTALTNPSTTPPAGSAGLLDTLKLAPAGGLGGGQIGYNWQIGRHGL